MSGLSDPDVVDRTRTLADYLVALQNPEQLRLSRGEVLKALDQARQVLTEMRVAIDQQTAPLWSRR